VLGTLAIAAGLGWTYVIATSSCPHVYAWNGREFVLDADPLSGSLFRGAEGVDMDRLEALAPDRGRYRVRVMNERDERDVINSVALAVADVPEGVEALPTQAEQILGVEALAAPIACRDTAGADARALVVALDELVYGGAEAAGGDGDAEGEPRARLTCTFDRPVGDGDAVLVLRARSSALAAEAFARYLAEMGPGLAPLLAWSEGEECCPYRERVAEEMRRLGLPIDVRVGAAASETVQVDPIGPAVFRSQAVPVRIPAGAEPTIDVQLELSPLLWEIDQVQLGRGRAVEPVRLAPRAARGGDGADLTGRLGRRDEARVTLAEDDLVDLEFDAPPAPPAGMQRSVVLEISGYYEFDVGGRAWLDPFAIWRHQTGRDSLPRFALRMARERAR
jgi:hypothetical protein